MPGHITAFLLLKRLLNAPVQVVLRRSRFVVRFQLLFLLQSPVQVVGPVHVIICCAPADRGFPRAFGLRLLVACNYLRAGCPRVPLVVLTRPALLRRLLWQGLRLCR